MRSLSERGLLRRRGSWTAVLAVVAVMVFGPATTAAAAVAGGFEIDGDLSLGGAGSQDWASLGAATCVVDGMDDSSGYKGDEDSAVDSWSREGVSSGKADIVRSQTHTLVDPEDGHQWTYLAVERHTTEGSTYYTFEYNQRPNHQSSPKNGPAAPVPTRTSGDLRLRFEQQGSGQNGELGKIVVHGMDRWLDGAWFSQTIIPSAVAGLSNTAALPGFCGGDTVVPGAFVEIALDLTVLGMEPGCGSTGFGTFNVRSRQSPSTSSEMTDFASGTVDVAPNCGVATVVKRGPSGEVVGDAALRFEVSPDPRDGTGSAFLNDNVTTGLEADELADLDERLGYVSFDTSRFGTYTITEVAPPAGYLLPSDASATVVVARYSRVSVEITDPLGTATVLKVDATTGDPLGGAEFTFTKAGGPYAGTTVTVVDNGSADLDDRAGYLRAGGLYTGTWEVHESAAPAGYSLDGTRRTVTVSNADPDPVLQTAFENQQNGVLAWAKTGEDGSTRLAGAEFRLERLVNGSVVETLPIIDDQGRDGDPDDGEFRVEGLLFGTWRVTETQAPSGYVAAAPNTVTVTAQEHTATFTVVNTENGALSWRKVDEFGTVLHGAGFTLINGTQQVVVADNTGQPGYRGPDQNATVGHFTVAGLDFGTWTLSETTVPEGYAGSEPLGCTLTASSPTCHVGDVVNAQDGRVSWSKVGEDGQPLAGAEFALTMGDQRIVVVDNGGVDTDGRVGYYAVSGLDFGTWTLTESVVPTGYTGPAAPLTFAVSATAQTVGLGPVENQMNGRLAWSKVDESGAPLAGAAFTLRLGGQSVIVADNTGQPGYTGRDLNAAVGVFAVEGLDFGTWQLDETTVPTGYAATAPRDVVVAPSATPILLGPIVNTMDGRASWTKVGEQGEPLEGATFTLTMGQQSVVVVDNGTGDADPDNGEFLATGLDFGTWTLTETAAPSGYTGSFTGTFAVDARHPAYAFTTPIVNTEDGHVVWGKVDRAGAPLGGATFALTHGGTTVTVPDNGPTDTDARDGYFSVVGLDFGTWTLSETAPPSGYTGTFEITFALGASNPVYTLAAPVVNIQDGRAAWTKVDEDGALLGGATFTLVSGGDSVIVRDNELNDADPVRGSFLVTGLSFGDWTLTETEAPRGYAGGFQTSFSIDAADPSFVLAVGVVNTMDARVAWTKVDEDGELLGGATFALSAGDIVVTVRDNGPSDSDPDLGGFLVTGLDFATWTLTETRSPDGYAGTFEVTFDLTDEDPAYTVVEPIVNTANGEASWTKVDDDGEPLAGATFVLTLGEQRVTVADNGTNDLDKRDGSFRVTGLDFGTWTIQETVVPQGYAGAFTGSFHVDPVDPVASLPAVVNTEDGKVAWTKVDEEGSPLGGAVFRLSRGQQSIEVEDNTGQAGYEGRDTDDRPGAFRVTGLRFGTWTLAETEAPDGYVADTEPRDVVVSPEQGSADAGAVVNEAQWAVLDADKTVYEFRADGVPVESDGTVAFGDEVLYGIDVVGDGNVTQSNVVVRDVVPVGTTVAQESAGCEPVACDIAYDAATRTLSWSLGELEPGEVVTVFFGVTVDGAPQLQPGQTYTRTVDNTAFVASDQVPETATDTVTVTASTSAPPAPSITPPTTPETPPAATPPPASPVTTGQPEPLAHTGVDGLPQTLGTAVLLVVVGAGMWRVSARRAR